VRDYKISVKKDLLFYNIGTTKIKLFGDYKIKYVEKDITKKKNNNNILHEQSCPHL